MKSNDNLALAEVCNCEQAGCEAMDDHLPGQCSRLTDGNVKMMMLGTICGKCAVIAIATGGAHYLTDGKGNGLFK